MFVLIGIGYFLFKKKLITTQGSKELGNLLLYIIMPSVILKSFIGNDMNGRGKELLLSFLLSFVALLCAMLISHIAFGKQKKIENFGVSFSNAGFMGIPLVQATLGDEAVFYVTSFVIFVNLLQWTYGVILMTDKFDAIKLNKIVKNPVVIAMFVGVLIYVTNIPIAEVISKPLLFCSNMNAPIAMITLGVYLGQTSIRDCVKDKDLYLTAGIRLIVIPLTTMLFLKIVPSQFETMKLAILIAAAAPIGSNVAIFAQLYGLNYKKAVQEVCFSTIISIITMPLI